MSRAIRTPLIVFLAFMPGIQRGGFAQQIAAPSPQGRGGLEGPVELPLLFRETWKQQPYTGELDDVKRRIRITEEVVSNPNLELKLYGPDTKDVLLATHEGRHDLWTGLETSPVAATLRDRTNYIDLTGRSRLRWITRTGSLHVLHPVIKLPDGTMLAGSSAGSTDGEFLESEVAFRNQRWFKLDPEKIVTTIEVKSPDLSKVDEIGFVDLMPGGGKGVAGWVNVSVIELYAKSTPRGSESH